MSKLNKLAEGHYVSEDRSVEVVEYDGQFLVNELQGNRYVTVAKAKTVSAAETEANKVLKAQAKPQEDDGVDVVETTPAQIAGASGAHAAGDPEKDDE